LLAASVLALACALQGWPCLLGAILGAAFKLATADLGSCCCDEMVPIVVAKTQHMEHGTAPARRRLIDLLSDFLFAPAHSI
jgi:hypothetical protein